MSERSLFQKSKIIKLAIASFMLTCNSSPSIARPLVPILDFSAVSVMLVVVDANSQCISFVYDANGNRISTSSIGLQQSVTWGSGSYGCFVWAAP